MNVIREDIDALHALIKIRVTPEDYKSKISETLNKYRKTANIPGFRAGHAPLSFIQKQYGKTVLFEEVSKW